MNTTTRERTRKINAGRDFSGVSFTLKCIIIAPSIRTAIPIAAGLTNSGIHIPTINSKAKRIYKVPIIIINQCGKP